MIPSSPRNNDGPTPYYSLLHGCDILDTAQSLEECHRLQALMHALMFLDHGDAIWRYGELMVSRLLRQVVFCGYS